MKQDKHRARKLLQEASLAARPGFQAFSSAADVYLKAVHATCAVPRHSLHADQVDALEAKEAQQSAAAMAEELIREEEEAQAKAKGGKKKSKPKKQAGKQKHLPSPVQKNNDARRHALALAFSLSYYHSRFRCISL